MKRACTLLALACIAIASWATSSAAADIEVAPGSEITLRSNGATTFNMSIIDISCSYTLTGDALAGPIADEAGQVIGQIEEAEIGECSGGSISSVLDLPYDLSFHGLTETGLEFGIEGVSFEFQMRIFGIPVSCLYGGDVPALVELNSGVTGDISIASNNIPKQGGAGSCPTSGSMEGDFTLEEQQTITLTT